MPAFCLLPPGGGSAADAATAAEAVGVVTSSTSALGAGVGSVLPLLSRYCSMWQLLTDMRTVEAWGCWVAAVLCSPRGKKPVPAASAGWGWLAVAGESPVGGRGGS